MSKTLNQRLLISQQLMSSGKGLEAIAGADADVVLVKQPLYRATSSDPIDVWKSYPADTVKATFGVS